jgi:ubiquinol-cytochrome c reductase cytochrome c subunit
MPSAGGVLYQQSCASCHGERGEGSQRGPALVGVGAASVDFQLSTGRMPLTTERYMARHRRPAFSAADIDALVRYVTAFGGDGPAIPTVGPGNPSTGAELYLAYCAACHSATGVGGALTGGQAAPALNKATAVQVAEAIRVGPGLMPAFPATALDDRQVDAIAAYVHALQHGQDADPGGFSLARIGPVTEGVVAWVVGLALLVLIARRLGSRER